MISPNGQATWAISLKPQRQGLGEAAIAMFDPLHRNLPHIIILIILIIIIAHRSKPVIIDPDVGGFGSRQELLHLSV